MGLLHDTNFLSILAESQHDSTIQDKSILLLSDLRTYKRLWFESTVPRFIHVAVWVSGYHNPGVRLGSRHRRYLYVNSILIKTTFDSDLMKWIDLGVSTNPPISSESW